MPDNLVCVRTFTYRYEAEIARSLLESSDIPSYVSADDAGGMRPVLLVGAGGARLIVRRQDAERARRLLDDPGDSAEEGYPPAAEPEPDAGR